MPDRQRHGRLSQEPVSGDSDSGPETMDLGRPAWELSVRRARESDRPDPMADTTKLSRVVVPESAEPGTEADTGLDTAAGLGGDTDFPRGADAGIRTDGDAGAGTTSATRAGARTPVGTGPINLPQSLRSMLERWSLRSLFERHRRRFAIGAAAVVALGALLALPPVRAQLRDSFTRLPQPYTALYFTSPPQVDGTVLTVPVSVHAVETGTDSYSVKVWTVDAKGVTDDSRTADLVWDGQAMSAVVSMPVNPAAEYVWVSLAGSDETLHYKIAVA